MKRIIVVLWKAAYNFFDSLSIDISGYIAYTSFLALFPFIMLLVSLAGYLGTTEETQSAIIQFYTLIPPQVVEAISPIIKEVTHEPAHGRLTALILIILWISSSSIEAIREGLNHAYGIQEKRSFYYRRLQAILFVLLGSGAFFMASFILIILPVGLEIINYLEKYLGKIPDLPELSNLWNTLIPVLSAYMIIFTTMVTMYRWLPYHKIKIRYCLPGALISSALWILMAALFSLYLQNFARYDILYGSLGGMIITLVFFQITAVLILYGAHINRVLRD
jgi:membrane protein